MNATTAQAAEQNQESWSTHALSMIGKRLGIDAHYFAKNSFILTLNYVLSVLSGLVTGYLVARLLPQETYGSYRFVISVAGMLSLITLPGLSAAVARDIAQKGKEGTPLLFTIKWNTILSFPGVLLLFAAIFLLPLWHQESQWPLFAIAGVLFLPINIGNSFFDGIINGTGAFRKDLHVTAVTTILTIVSVLTVLWLLRSPVILYGLTAGIPALVSLWMLRRMLPEYPSREHSWRVLRYASFLSLNTIPITLALYFDSFFLSAFCGLKALALFQVSSLIPEQIKTWHKSMLPVSLRKQAMGQDTVERRKKLQRIVFLATGIMTTGILLYCLAAPLLMSFLFPNYDTKSLVLLTRLIALSLALLPFSLFNQFLETQGFIREQRRVQLLSTAVYVILLILLIPQWGALGAAITRVIYRTTSNVLSYDAVRRAPLQTA